MTEAIEQIKKNMVSITEIINKQKQMEDKIHLLEIEVEKLKDENMKLQNNQITLEIPEEDSALGFSKLSCQS